MIVIGLVDGQEVLQDPMPIKTEAVEILEEEPWLTVEATAYTAFCDSGCIGVTRTGYDVSNTIYYEGMRVIAIDPNVIPLHSILEVKTDTETYTAIALDTGGAIKGNRIDILMDTKNEAYQFGRQNAEVRILKEVE